MKQAENPAPLAQLAFERRRWRIQRERQAAAVRKCESEQPKHERLTAREPRTPAKTALRYRGAKAACRRKATELPKSNPRLSPPLAGCPHPSRCSAARSTAPPSPRGRLRRHSKAKPLRGSRGGAPAPRFALHCRGAKRSITTPQSFCARRAQKSSSPYTGEPRTPSVTFVRYSAFLTNRCPLIAYTTKNKNRLLPKGSLTLCAKRGIIKFTRREAPSYKMYFMRKSRYNY